MDSHAYLDAQSAGKFAEVIDFPSLLHAWACLSKPSGSHSLVHAVYKMLPLRSTSIRNPCMQGGMSTLRMGECIHALSSKRPARPLSALVAEERSRMFVSSPRMTNYGADTVDSVAHDCDPIPAALPVQSTPAAAALLGSCPDLGPNGQPGWRPITIRCWLTKHLWYSPPHPPCQDRFVCPRCFS